MYDAVCKLGESVFDDDCGHYFRTTLRDVDLRSLIVMNGRSVIGFALLSEGRQKRGLPYGLEISFLCIHPDYQRQGIGSALLQEVKKLKYDYVWLQVSYENTDAAALYARHGFKYWGNIGTGEWRGYTMGYSTQQHEWQPRLRSRVLLRVGETSAPYLALLQSDSTPLCRSRLRSARNLRPTPSSCPK